MTIDTGSAPIERIRKEAPLFDHNEFMVVLDREPMVAGHILVVAASEVQSLADLDSHQSLTNLLLSKELNGILEGEAFLFAERGRAKFCTSGFTTCHAHGHVLPIAALKPGTVAELVVATNALRYDSLQSALSAARSTPCEYLLIAVSDSEAYLALPSPVETGEKRFLRNFLSSRAVNGASESKMSPSPRARPSGSRATTDETARDIIKEIWHRARINAFAHKVASERISGKGRTVSIAALAAGVLSILFVILVYLMNTATDGEAARRVIVGAGFDPGVTALLFACLSIIMSMASMMLGVLNNIDKYDAYAMEHRFLCNTYQHIAQRARAARWPGMPNSEVEELLRDLERDFQLLKARGQEPSDADFDKATAIFKKVQGDKSTRMAQSYDLGDEPHGASAGSVAV